MKIPPHKSVLETVVSFQTITKHELDLNDLQVLGVGNQRTFEGGGLLEHREFGSIAKPLTIPFQLHTRNLEVSLPTWTRMSSRSYYSQTPKLLSQIKNSSGGLYIKL